MELVEQFTRSEVELTLKQMAPLKAPGLDGMPPIFYQYYWDNIREEVTKAVLSFLTPKISIRFESYLPYSYPKSKES